MAKDIANASMKLAHKRNVLQSQHGHRIDGDVQLYVRRRLPLSHTPRVFPQPKASG